jgi:hypothetical protein
MKKTLGEILIAAGAVTRADIEAALSDQSAGEPARLGDLLVSLGKLTPLQLARALSQQYGVKFISVPPLAREVLEAVPMDLQRRFRFVPIKVAQGSISVAMADLSHASSDVLPVLRKRWGTVNLFVSPADEIDALHAQQAGPTPAPVSPSASRKRPVVTASDDELFAALDLALPSGTPAPEDELELAELEVLSGLEPMPSPVPQAESFELDVPEPGLEVSAPRPAKGDSFPDLVVEDALELTRPVPATRALHARAAQLPHLEAPTVFVAPLPEAFEEPLAAELYLEQGEPGGSSVDLEVAVTESGLSAAVARPAAVGSDDHPFFETAPQAVPIAALDDVAFVPDVPTSSGSSLARLVIAPEPAPISTLPPVTLPRPVPPMPPAPRGPSSPGALGGGHRASAPVAVAPRPSPAVELPDWLKASATGVPLDPQWTGALEDMAPSKLITAVTRALIRRGVLSEQDVLDAAVTRKK